MKRIQKLVNCKRLARKNSFIKSNSNHRLNLIIIIIIDRIFFNLFKNLIKISNNKLVKENKIMKNKNNNQIKLVE